MSLSTSNARLIYWNEEDDT